MSLFSSLFGAVQTAATNVVGAIGNAVGNVVSAAEAAASNLATGATGGAVEATTSNIFTGAASLFGNVVGGIVGAVESVIGGTTGVIGSVVNGAAGAVQNVIENAVINLVVGVVKSVEAPAVDTITNAALGFINKVETTEPIATIVHTVNTVATTVDQATTPTGSIGSMFSPDNTTVWPLLTSANNVASIVEKFTLPNSPALADITHSTVQNVVSSAVTGFTSQVPTFIDHLFHPAAYA